MSVKVTKFTRWLNISSQTGQSALMFCVVFVLSSRVFCAVVQGKAKHIDRLDLLDVSRSRKGHCRSSE